MYIHLFVSMFRLPSDIWIQILLCKYYTEYGRISILPTEMSGNTKGYACCYLFGYSKIPVQKNDNIIFHITLNGNRTAQNNAECPHIRPGRWTTDAAMYDSTGFQLSNSLLGSSPYWVLIPAPNIYTVVLQSLIYLTVTDSSSQDALIASLFAVWTIYWINEHSSA